MIFLTTVLVLGFEQSFQREREYNGFNFTLKRLISDFFNQHIKNVAFTSVLLYKNIVLCSCMLEQASYFIKDFPCQLVESYGTRLGQG